MKANPSYLSSRSLTSLTKNTLLEANPFILINKSQWIYCLVISTIPAASQKDLLFKRAIFLWLVGSLRGVPPTRRDLGTRPRKLPSLPTPQSSSFPSTRRQRAGCPRLPPAPQGTFAVCLRVLSLSEYLFVFK
ncbi:hypothetical protein AFLA_011590 [Aspergillus flavus NRRL3357]|nr:hypothetical protein AFLA_011590 [Aspergillus flavus NRRL3357]